MLRTISLIFLLVTTLARADHFSGSSITYECIGGGQYKIFLDLYLDCAGSAIVPQDLYFNSSCGTNFILPGLQPQYSEEFSPVCDAELQNITCNGGTLPGFRHFHFEVVTFLSSCNSWNINWRICCRNTMVNIQSLPGLYVSATVNTSGGFCDDSPVFTNPGVPFVCVNSTMHYNPGVIDPDGHAMSFALINARFASPSPTSVNYAPGHSGPVPIPGITINPLNGQIQFTPTVAGNYTVVIQVTSYKAGGQVIGTVMNDIMFIVPPCSGSAPVFEGLTNAVNGLVMGPNELAICDGMQFCVDLVFTDDDPAADLTVITNAASILPGSTFQTVGTGNSITATLCWTVTTPEFPFNLFVQASDGACPIANTASTFIFAENCYPLPVELISFEATALDDHVRLDWVTGSEMDFSHFVVERSNGEEAFMPIGTVEAVGSTAITSQYGFLDDEPMPGSNYYRLRQVDLDGQEEMSPVAVALYEPAPGILLVPDGHGGWWVHGGGRNSSWMLTDAMGRVYRSGSADESGSFYARPRPLSTGIQMLFVNTNKGMEAIKLPIVIFGEQH